MERYYEKPILLIEFDESIPFRLQDQYTEVGGNLGTKSVGPAQGGEISPASIISKLTLLTIHMKKLRIIWSKSPAHTADIFV